MEDFYPLKAFVIEMEDLGLIRDASGRFGERKRETSVWSVQEGPQSPMKSLQKADPVVYFYEVTESGRRFLLDQ
jgi:hypothetical protein